MTSTKYIGMDVHKESISIQVMNSVGKVVMECVIEAKASMILEFIDGLRGDLRVTFEEGTWAAWLYDLLKPHVTEVVVCNPRKAALLKDGSKGDRIDAHKLAMQLRSSLLTPAAPSCFLLVPGGDCPSPPVRLSRVGRGRAIFLVCLL
jgi:transposase